jgi:dolichyl-phosphate-mannose-protein mannosyltransferase
MSVSLLQIYWQDAEASIPYLIVRIRPINTIVGIIDSSITVAVRNRLWNSAGFFMLIWAVHYIPFYLMNRQLFIHHYLPSHLASALVAGAILSFVLSETINYPISIRGPKTQAKPSQFADLGVKGPVIVVVFNIILFAMFVYMAPLTYGTPG